MQVAVRWPATGRPLPILVAPAVHPQPLQSMPPSTRPATAALALALLIPGAARAQGAAAPTDNCEGIRQQIEARYRAGGLPGVQLQVVGAGSGGGRVVGSCGSGSRQIVLVNAGAAAPRPAERPVERAPDRPGERPGERPADRPPERSADKIPTECKDGSVVIGPNCDDPRAVRMTPAEIASSVAAPPATPASPATPATTATPARAASQ